jgi:hypothetical protein
VFAVNSLPGRNLTQEDIKLPESLKLIEVFVGTLLKIEDIQTSIRSSFERKGAMKDARAHIHRAVVLIASSLYIGIDIIGCSDVTTCICKVADEKAPMDLVLHSFGLTYRPSTAGREA